MSRKDYVPVPLVAILVIATLSAFIAWPAGLHASTKGQIERDYLEVLELLTDGAADQALKHLLATETEATSENSNRQIEVLDKRQRSVARRLTSNSPEALVPIALLHEQAYLSHLEAGRIKLAIHSRRRAVDLVTHYTDRSKQPDADRLASDLFTSLGGHLQDASMASVAIVLYQNALLLHPENSTAQLGLAGLFERQGSYELTVAHLEQLLQHDNTNREARLRLGINLLRLEQTEVGLSILDELLLLDDEDWILSLAYQEIARARTLAGDRNGAYALLVEASERLPDDSSLAVQAAYLSARTERRSPGVDLAASLQSAARSASPSPRSLYSRVCGRALDQLRDVIAQQGEHRLSDLAEAVGRSAPKRQAAP